MAREPTRPSPSTIRESVRDPHLAVEKTVRGTAMTAMDGPAPVSNESAQPVAMRTELTSGARRRSASGAVMSRATAMCTHCGVVLVVSTHTRP